MPGCEFTYSFGIQVRLGKQGTKQASKFIFQRGVGCEEESVDVLSDAESFLEFGRIVYNKSAKNCINIVDLADLFECS